MNNFYIPRTKKELIEYLRKHMGEHCYRALRSMKKKQLYAIYYKSREKAL